MKRVKIAEFKNRLSEHLRAVERGAEIEITDRDRPIARVSPAASATRVSIIYWPTGNQPPSLNLHPDNGALANRELGTASKQLRTVDWTKTVNYDNWGPWTGQPGTTGDHGLDNRGPLGTVDCGQPGTRDLGLETGAGGRLDSRHHIN